MTTTPHDLGSTTPRGTARTDAARDHLWMHFTRHSTYEQGGQVHPEVVARGVGALGSSRGGGAVRCGGHRVPQL